MRIEFYILGVQIILFFINIILLVNIKAIIRRKFRLTRKLIVEQNNKIKCLNDELNQIEYDELTANIL